MPARFKKWKAERSGKKVKTLGVISDTHSLVRPEALRARASI
jgi:hypothetical protein